MAATDEAIDLVDAYLRGDVVTHGGPVFRAERASVGPRPTQQPRPPIWFGGMKPAARRRAARLDGWIAIAVSDDGSAINLDAAGLEAMVRDVRTERERLGRAGGPFDIAVFAFSDAGSSGVELARGYAAAGATWWLESLSGMRGSLDDLLARVEAGPPV
jgi:alkanesulfonate monooxygenase SsuD/methylene tetrahydromethanopterin reductase-like flavin-dependent oxidoreductase (luciferase family)